ncbi:ATP-binding cassette domain-containing protein [Thermodesulfovibrio yellowstonii]|uniref:ATP-binding cassette domain-containing protein n=1 Tax=Thermodesulfovibrio yellowstonii TaxID=28262 RepID=UPI003C7C0512
MIKVIGLTGEFINKQMNFEVEKGSKTVFIFEKDEQGSEFLKIVTGIKSPNRGEVILMGRRLNELTRDELFELRKKISIVFKTGGLISNLKTWENLMLPALYHKIADEESITKRRVEILKELAFKREPMCSISQLTKFEKRLIGIARAFLMMPEIIIFEYPFDGLEESEKKWLTEKIEKLRYKATILYILGSEKEGLLIEKANIIKNAEN